MPAKITDYTVFAVRNQERAPFLPRRVGQCIDLCSDLCAIERCNKLDPISAEMKYSKKPGVQTVMGSVFLFRKCVS